jgi:hypothetical protein
LKEADPGFSSRESDWQNEACRVITPEWPGFAGTIAVAVAVAVAVNNMHDNMPAD